MNQIVEFVIFVLFIISFFAVAFEAVRLRFKNYKLNKEVEQSVLNYIILSNKLQELIKNEDKKSIEETDGFLKFVSDSRDWAFQYIEDVQGSIVDLKKSAALLNMESQYLTKEELEQIKNSIVNVILHLPDDLNNN